MKASKYPGRPPHLMEIFSTYECPVYFVTFNAFQRQPILATPAVHTAFRQYAIRGTERRAATVGRYVIMPDHLHFFVGVADRVPLGRWIQGLKRALSAAIGKLPGVSSHWQPGFFDHLLRNDESYAQKWEYVRMNPVRAGLVMASEDWPYQGEIVPIDRL